MINSTCMITVRCLIADDYQVLSLDNQPSIAKIHNSTPINSSSTSSAGAQSNITPLKPSSRHEHRRHSAAVDDCIFERIFAMPIGKYSDELTDDENLLRIIVKRSTSFGLDGDFRVYNHPSNATGSDRVTSEWFRTNSTKPDSSSSPALDCFYTGHVVGMTSSSWVVLSVHVDSVVSNVVLLCEFVRRSKKLF